MALAADARGGPYEIVAPIGAGGMGQVRGEAADPRADVFAVGAILYEMVMGQRASRGDSPADTMSAILREHPSDITLHGASPAFARVHAVMIWIPSVPF